MVSKALNAIKGTFSAAIEVAHPSLISQRGLYLFLNGIEPREQIGGTVSMLLLIAEHSLTKNTSSAADKLDETIKKVQELVLLEGDNWSFGGVKAAIFEGSTLFVYAIEIKIKV